MDDLKKVGGCCAPSEEIKPDITVKRMMEIQYLLALEIMKRVPYTNQKWDYCEQIIKNFMEYYQKDEDDPLS